MYSNVALFVVVVYVFKVIYNVDSFHINGFKSKHVDKISSFNNNNHQQNRNPNHIIEMSKLTDSAQEKLLKDAENLRKMADTLEKTNETDSTQDSGFISTYAIKIANNITKQKQNETLYFGPTKPSFTSANVTKEYLLIDRSNSDDETPTVKLENLIKTTMLEYLNISETELENADVKVNMFINSNTSSTSPFGTPSFQDAESIENLIDTTYTLRIFLSLYTEILQLQPNSETYAALQILDDYMQWHINTLYQPFKQDASNKMKLDQAFIYLARKLEIERFLRRLNKDPKYLLKLQEPSYKPSEQDHTIATSFMEHNVYFDVAYDTLSDGTIVINSQDAYLCANKFQNDLLQALALPVRKDIDKYIAYCIDKSENGRKGLFQFLGIENNFFSKFALSGFLNILPKNDFLEATQSIDDDENEVFKQVLFGEAFNTSVTFINEQGAKAETSFHKKAAGASAAADDDDDDESSKNMEDIYQELMENVKEPIEIYNNVIRTKLIQSLRLYTTSGWYWPKYDRSFSLISSPLPPRPPVSSSDSSTTSTSSSNTENLQSPAEVLKKFPQLSEMMFKLPSVGFLLKDVTFTPTELALHRKNITYYISSSSMATSSSSSSFLSSFPFFNNKNKNQAAIEKPNSSSTSSSSSTRMIFPVALLKGDSKVFFYQKLVANCNIVRGIIDTFLSLNANSTDDEVVTVASKISPYSIAASLAAKKEAAERVQEEEEQQQLVVDRNKKRDNANSITTTAATSATSAATTTRSTTTTASTDSILTTEASIISTENQMVDSLSPKAKTATIGNNTTTTNEIKGITITTTDTINNDNDKDSNNDNNSDDDNDSLFATRDHTKTEIISNDKNLSNNFQKQFQEFMNKLDSEGGNELSLLSQPKSVVDAFIRQYFDENSRTKGSALSRQGAGLFQNEMLKGIMEVNNVTPLYGAYIFDGRYVTRNSKQFYEKLNSKFENGTIMSNDLSYIITTNRQYPAMNDTITDIAYAMMGETTSVILFPKSWNTTLQSSEKQLRFQSFFKSLNILSSAIVAGNCYNLFDPNNSPLAKDNTQLPDGYIGLVILPIMLQVIPLIVESIVAAQKGIKITSIQLPAWVSLPTFGYRSVYTSRPKTRNDMFDIAAVGWFSSFVLSFATALIGLKLTAEASSDVLESFPTISVLLLQLNPIVKQVLGSVFPLAAATPATAMDTVIHLHWIAIAGLMSMIVNALQLIPTNQSVGNKLLYSFYGIYQYSIVQQAVALFRFVFNAVWIIASFSFTESIFTLNSRSALLFTFLFSEIQAFLPTEQGEQVVVDDVTGITESRKIAFAGITCLLAFVLFSDGLSEMAVDLGNLIKGLIDSGSPKNQLF